jgi:hypothetical protein
MKPTTRDIVQPVLEHIEKRLRELDQGIIESASERPELTPDEDVDYFGGCPHCHGTDGMVDVRGNHWFICRRHLLRWCGGWNLFSAWKEAPEESHVINYVYLASFEETDDVYLAPQNISPADGETVTAGVPTEEIPF